tara:strand:- start:176 stop:448 length:273 start_codon:yes stop_codon:yes gene_type:complete
MNRADEQQWLDEQMVETDADVFQHDLTELLNELVNQQQLLSDAATSVDDLLQIAYDHEAHLENIAEKYRTVVSHIRSIPEDSEDGYHAKF